MAVIKARPDDLFRYSLIPVSGDLYDELLRILQIQLKQELALITANALRKAIRECNCSKGVVAVLPRNAVRLSVFIQSAVEGFGGMFFEVRISLPVLGTPPEHQAIWNRLLHKQFPWHSFPDGELQVTVGVPGACHSKLPNGVIGLRNTRDQAA